MASEIARKRDMIIQRWVIRCSRLKESRDKVDNSGKTQAMEHRGLNMPSDNRPGVSLFRKSAPDSQLSGLANIEQL